MLSAYNQLVKTLNRNSYLDMIYVMFYQLQEITLEHVSTPKCLGLLVVCRIKPLIQMEVN